MIKTMLAVLLFAVAAGVYAGCTQTQIFTPDGNIMICRNCCDENGQCRITCL